LERAVDILTSDTKNILVQQYAHPIYVHCLHGQDRTGYVIAAYRMLIQGWSFKRAYQEAKDMGHKWWFAPYLLFWPKSLKELK
jgi:protein-tyrosine phosphatase